MGDERISDAAVMFETPEGEFRWETLPRPNRHGDILDAVKTAHPEWAIIAYGFKVESKQWRRFTFRSQAMKIARHAGQLLDPTTTATELYTEDLW